LAAEADRSHGAIADLIGRLVSHEETDGAERRRLLGRLSDALAENARHLRSLRERGRWLTDLFLEVARRLPVRDRETLILHHGGLTGERLADSLVRTAANATAVVGAVGGALAAVELAAPPLLLSAPAQLVAETLVVAAIEVKLIAELHEVYGQPVPGNGGRRAAAYALAWAKRRGVDPLNPGWTSAALNGAARDALRRRLTRLLGRHLTTLGPFLTGAVAGGTLNRAATKQLAAAVRADLRAIASRSMTAPAAAPAMPRGSGRRLRLLRAVSSPAEARPSADAAEQAAAAARRSAAAADQRHDTPDQRHSDGIAAARRSIAAGDRSAAADQPPAAAADR